MRASLMEPSTIDETDYWLKDSGQISLYFSIRLPASEWGDSLMRSLTSLKPSQAPIHLSRMHRAEFP